MDRIITKPTRRADDIREGDICIYDKFKVIVEQTFNVNYAVRIIGYPQSNVFAYRFVSPSNLELDPDSYNIQTNA